MDLREHLIILIDRLEYRLTEEINFSMFGCIEICSMSIYDSLVECLKARKEINYSPYESVAALLDRHMFDELYIKRFLRRIPYVNEDIFVETDINSLHYRLMQFINLQEYHITRMIGKNMICAPEPYFVSFYIQLKECLAARKEIRFPPFDCVENLLESIGYSESFITEFITKVNIEKNNDY